MELYLSACAKAANVAAHKTNSSTVATDSQQCGDGAHKTQFPGVGAAQLLDLPLGVKLPVIPGSDTVYFTTNISEKLFRPSYDFNLTDPYCRLLENQYKSLHDPHLREYYKRKDILRRLKKGGYITSNNKIVCTLKELNKYRQYLTSLKLDFERNYSREQEMIAKQLHKLQHRHETGITQFHNWLLQDGTQSVKDQERLIRHRYLDMISKELDQLERTAEEQRLLRMDREERRQREYTRKKLNLRRKIEEEWKTKEMLLLTRIGEDVKREQRVEEQRRKSREESDKKKQAMLEKKMAYHLQKMQDTGFREDTGKSTIEYRGYDGTTHEFSPKKKKRSDEVKVVGEQKSSKESNGPIGNSLHQSPSMSKNAAKISATSVDVQNTSLEQKKNESYNKKPSAADDKGTTSISNADLIASNQNSPTRNYYKQSQLFSTSPKPEIPVEKLSEMKEKQIEQFETVGIISPQDLLQSCLQEKVTSEELNSIIHNIMTWVVATVTSILYPAITKYEERLKHSRYPVSDDSDLSSDSSSFCSTCSEEFTHRRFTSTVAKTFHTEPCTFDGSMSVKRQTTPLKPPSAHVEKTVVEKTEQREEQSVTSQVTYNRASIVYPIPRLRTSKSDSHLFTSLDTGTKTSKDATTETESVDTSLICDKKTKATAEMKNLKNVFVNFKCHLQGETQMILESVFQEIMSDLTQAIPSLSSVTAEVYVDPYETDKEDLLSNVDICSVASEIVENMLEKLECAVEKKCFQMFSQEDLSNIETSLSTTGEYFTSLSGKPSRESLCFHLEPMRDIAEDMVHAILEKLLTIASCKKSESPHEDTTKHTYQQQRMDATYRAVKKSSSESDMEANLIIKEEIQNLISSIFSRPSLVGYIEEAISTILGYIQTELNNDRLTASEETVILLQLLDDVLTQLHRDPVKPSVCQIQRQCRLRYTDNEEKYRLIGPSLSPPVKSRKRLPLVNVPGMVLYSEDESEEIDNMVKNVLESSFKEEKVRSQEPIPNPWFCKEHTCFEYMKKRKPSSKCASERNYALNEWDSDEDILKEKPFLKKDNSLFSQDQKHQIVKTSENMVKCILTDMLRDLSCVSPGHIDNKFSKKGLLHQENIDQLVSVSEINEVAEEIIDAVLSILHKSLICTPTTSKSTTLSSGHPTFLDSCDIPHKAKETPNKQPLKVWFDSGKKMKYLSSLNTDSSKPSWLRSEESEPQHIDDITEKIINAIFSRLKTFVCQKLHLDPKPSPTEKSSFKSQLITYTTKIVSIVLHSIQNELELNKVNHTKLLTSKGIFADSDKRLESHETNLSEDNISPLLSFIYEMLSSESEDQRGVSLSLDRKMSETSYESNVDKQNVLPSLQDKKAFHKYLATPCILHSVINGKDLKENANLQVLDRIGETLHEMLSKLMDAHPDPQTSCNQQDREKKNKDHQRNTTLQSNVPLVSKTILEYIISKLCSVDTNINVESSECKAVSKTFDIDNLSFSSIMEEMSKCTNIISSILSKMMHKDKKEVVKSKVKNITVVEATTNISKDLHPNKLKSVASDILSTVFAKLEGFTSGNLETHDTTQDEKKKGNKIDSECASNDCMTDTPEGGLQHALYAHAKKISNAILKAVQTELSENSPDLSTPVNNPLETQTFMNIVNLILDAVSSSGECNETENGGTESCGYQPVYGNFLPGGAESDSFTEECNAKTIALREETETDSPQQQVLERTLNKIEVKLKKQRKSPIIPIIRNILNEIFQNTLINQLNELSLSHSHLNAMPHSIQESTAQASVPFVEEMMGPLISDTDVRIVANDVVKTVFHKLCSAAILERNISKSRCETITFSANVSFREHSYRRSSSVTMLNSNPCTLRPGFNVDRQTMGNVGEDIVKAILTNLESFATSKVNSLFFSQVNFTVPVTLPTQQDKTTSSKALSDTDSHSNEQFPYCAEDHGKSNPLCQLSLSKLSIYATQVARKILQGIKHELDKERESPSLDQSVAVSENIASQVVNTMLDIVSCQNKCSTPISDKENDLDMQKSVTGKLFDNTEYRKNLCFQIQDTTESILYNIYEKVHNQNVSLVTPMLKCDTAFKQAKEKSELLIEGESKFIPKHSVPKSDVILLSSDIIDSVLYHLGLAVTIVINTKLPDAPKLTFSDILPKAEGPTSLFMELKNEGKAEHFLYSRSKESASSDCNQIATEEQKDTKGCVLDPCEESANFITEAICNHLQSFAVERIGPLITPVMQPIEKSLISQELESCKQGNMMFHESSQVESCMNIKKITVTKSILKQGLLESTFANYTEKPASIIHLSHANLMDYAYILASAILKLIKSDFEFKVQNMDQYPSSILFQENIIVSETVDNILNILCSRRTTKETSLPSKENLNFLPLAVSNEVALGHIEKDKKSTMSLFNNPLHQRQMALEQDSQRIVLEEIFMRKKESRQKEKSELLSAVKQILYTLDQRAMDVMGYLPTLNETPHIPSNSKIKTSDTTQKHSIQPYFYNVAKDIVENVLGELYSLVMTTVCKNTTITGEPETTEDNDISPVNHAAFRETKEARKRSKHPRYGTPEMCGDSNSASLLEDPFLPYSPVQVGKDLVQMVSNKITNFISRHAKESLSPEACSNELQLFRPQTHTVSPKGSPKLGFKTNLKAKAKATSLTKFKTKTYIGPCGGKVKSKIKCVNREKTLIDGQSKAAMGLPHSLTMGEAKHVLKTKLPTLELIMYAKDIISVILETTLKELEKVTETRAMAKMKTLPYDQITEASKIINKILQELYATSNHSLAYPIKLSSLDALTCPQHTRSTKEQTCFYLENVSSQLEQIFPKEGIFKKMFDRWQMETNDMENEKCKLLIIAENILKNISIRARDLEYSLSLLHLPVLEDCASRLHNQVKESSTRDEDTKEQINKFGREIVEMLFEKLQFCFLSQMSIQESKETLTNRKEHLTAKRKHAFPSKQGPSSFPIYTMKTKDQISRTSRNQIVEEIVERVLNMLESFVDLQFKQISKYEFSDIVKMPIDNLSQIQQRLLVKKQLPKLQPLKKSSDIPDSSSIISKENLHNTLLEVHLFHSDLVTYAVDIVRDMLGIIKNKLDKEISQMEPYSVDILKENTVASETIGTLIDQCTNFHKSLIKNLPNKSFFPRNENVYIVNQIEFASRMKKPTSTLNNVGLGNNPAPRSGPGFVFNSEEDAGKKYCLSSSSQSYASSFAPETIKSSESMERPKSKTMASCLTNKLQQYSLRNSKFGHSDAAMNTLPEGSVLQKLFKKVNDSTDEALRQAMSFIDMGKGGNPKVFHYETLKPNEIQTTVSPLRICLAAENIVNTVLSNSGFPYQQYTNESMESMKPFFISGGGKKEEKNFHRVWCEPINCIPEKQSNYPEVLRKDCSLLQKWQKKNPTIKINTLKEVEVIAFADHELGPNEIHLVARHITTSVVTHLKNFKTRVTTEEKISIVSTISRKKYDSTHPPISIYSNSSIYQFCEYLTESVICNLITSISDGTKEDREKSNEWEIQEAAFNKIVSIHSQVFETRSICIGELALSIAETITDILSNGNIIEANIAQQIFSMKTKYIYCPGVTSSDFDDLFQDLLAGVIHVISKEIGTNHHFGNSARNKSFSLLRSNSMSICNKSHTTDSQMGSKEQESYTYQIDQLVQKNKLNYLAHRLDRLIGSLKTPESKEVVNKVFDIVLDLFLPDENPGGDMDSGKIAKSCFSSSSIQSNRILKNNLGLSPKSVFLLNIVCEKLIRTLLEKYTGTFSLENGSSSSETSAESQLLKILQSMEDGDFDFLRRSMDCEQFQGEYMSDLFENMAEIDQDLLSSDCILSFISHSLVKSLMDKLSNSLGQAPKTPCFENKYLNYQMRKIQSKRPDFKELGQIKGPFGITNCDSNPSGRSLNSSMASSKIKVPSDKKGATKSFLPCCSKQETKEMGTIPTPHKLCQRGINTGIYSATFLEEIISQLFFKLSTSLWRKNGNITEARLNKVNTLFVNTVVNEFNNAQITVLRNAEEKLCFPPVCKEIISKIVDTVYCDVLQLYQLESTYSNNLTYDNTSVAEQIFNSMLLEIFDYQLSSSSKRRFRPCSFYPLNAEIILQKLQNNLSKFTFQPRSSEGYSTMLPQSFLEDVIRKLLSQLLPSSMICCSLDKNYLQHSDFNEMSTYIINKVMSAISKHKICLTVCDNHNLYTRKNLRKMVDSVYSNILQMSDSLASVKRSIISRSPIMIDQIASFIIQEIIESHLQPFLCGEVLPRSRTPIDAVSDMVKQVLNEVIETHTPQNPSKCGIYPKKFVGEIVARLLSKIFSPKLSSEVELEKITRKIINTVHKHFDKAEIHIPFDIKAKYFPASDTDIVDELVTSVYRNVLQQHGFDPDIDTESEHSDIFVENVSKLIIKALSNYLLHPLFSGDLPTSSYSNSVAENIVHDILSNFSLSNKSSHSLPPYNTVLPYTFLEDMIGVLLSKFFPSASNMEPDRENTKDKSTVNYNEIASNLISDIRMKISQHEIRFSKDEDDTKVAYSENEVQHLVDSVFKNILRGSESQESVEQSIASSNDVFIDKMAGFIIKYICEQHLQPFLARKSSSSSSFTYNYDESQQSLFASVYSSSFLEDVVSGVVSKIFHRVVGIVQMQPAKNSDNELFDKAEKLIYLVIEEFSKAQVTVIDNAEEQLCLPSVERDVVRNIIDKVYSNVLEEHEVEILSDEDFLHNTKSLAARITKFILAEIIDFQIHPNLIENLPLKSYSKLSKNVLINRVQYDISKSRFRRQASTIYTTMLSHMHLEKIVTQLVSQINPLAPSSEQAQYTSKSDLNNTVIELINEIMSIISKHAICVTKHGNGKQNTISERDIQSMVDSIYADLSQSDLYQSLTRDRKGISNVPVSKVASFIIKEIFNHHLQSFLSGDKALLSASVGQTYKQKAIDTKKRELCFIVNSAVFLEEVISEVLCKILHFFICNVFPATNPERVEAKITDIVTTLVKSIVVEFIASEISVAEDLDKDLCFSEEYKDMVERTVNSVYEKVLDEYKSLVKVYEVIQSDATCFGRKIYHFLLEEIYDYHVQSLVSGELMPSSYTSPRADNIIRNVLSKILTDNNTMASCVTVFPRCLLEDMVDKLLVQIFSSNDTAKEVQDKEDTPNDDEFSHAASKLTEDIIKEIFEHEIRLATAEENEESTQLEAIESFVDSICSNILKKSEFQAEVKKDSHKKEGSFLSKIAGFIMRGIMDHHLQPFLYEKEQSSNEVPYHDRPTTVKKSKKEKTQPSLFSATFLEDVIVDLAHKFCSFPSLPESSKKKDKPEADIVGVAIKFANSLIGEFRKSEIKVLPNAEEVFSFPPIDKETVDTISNFVYDQFIGKFSSKDLQQDNGNIVIEMIAGLAKKAISAFKIQPLFSGDWTSTFFSFLNPDNITQRVQLLPQNAFTQITRYVTGKQLPSPDQSYKQKTLEKKEDIPDPILSSIAVIMKSNVINRSGSATDVMNKKDGNKQEISIQKHTEHLSNIISVTTIKERQESQEHLSEIEKAKSTPQDAEGQANELHQHYSVTSIDTEYKEKIQRSDLEIDIEKKIGSTSRSSIKLDDKPKTRNVGTTTEKVAKVTEKASKKERRSFRGQTGMDEAPYSDYGSVQNVIENIYGDVLQMSYPQEQFEITKPKYSKNSQGDKPGKDLSWSGSVITMDLPSSINQKVPFEEKEKEEKGNEKKREKEEVSEKEIENKLSNKVDTQDNKPGVFPAKFLEDVIAELVNKLIFTSSPQEQISDNYPDVNNEQHQAVLYDLALKLTDSLLKEFADAQIKVFRPDKEKELFSHASKENLVNLLPPTYKEPIKDESSFKIKMTEIHKWTPSKASLDTISLIEKVPETDKTLVNKVVHSTLCDVLKEHSSQESICEDITHNGESLAQRLTSSVINEIFQQQLNLLFGDNIPVSACLPLESKEIVKKLQRVAQTTSKECQTSSPYTILLPYKFLEDVISALLYKIFSKIPDMSTRVETSEDNAHTEIDFLQMKLVSTIAKQIAQDKDMIIQYVESLHPNDDEIIHLVAQSVYSNLLPQFGSEEVIRNCITSGCRLLSDSIVDLVLREVAGNQLQNYFCGELTPHQCAEIDSVVENILEDVIQTTPPPPPRVHKLSRNVIEEIAVKFLSKLFSMFPKGNKERTKFPEMEMEKMTSKILNSFQQFICKSRIQLIKPDKASPSVPLADNATIEKVVNSVYTNVLKHSGSHSSVFKDLLGKDNALSDIIGCLMVKEISKSEFQPQVEKEASNSELVLEAVKIMEKVVKIINELKSQEKSSPSKHSLLDGQILEEALAQFLAKLPVLPSAESKTASILSKPELNKIATQLTNTVSGEITRSHINLVTADPGEHSLTPHNMEIVTQVIDSIYSNILQQSGTLKELYDTRRANTAFPQKVASLIIDEVSKAQLDRVLSSNSAPFGELNISRIVEKAQKHTTNVTTDSDKELSDEETFRDPLPVKIVPHVREKPIKIDPNIVAQHLAVLSIKTQPIEQLQMECLKRTGQSIAELRRASITGRNHSSTSSSLEGKVKERRTSLDKTGRLDIKPCEAVCRNSFMNMKKPDITKIELLKDVRNKKELIIRLVAHDIAQEPSEMSRDEEIDSDEEELVLREFVAEEGLTKISEHQESQVLKPVESNIASPKSTISAKSLRKFLSLSNCCQSKTSVNIGKTEASSNQAMESDMRNIKRAVGELDMASSKSLAKANFPQEKKLHRKKEERVPINEPPHYFIHRIMSSSSYNQEDLISSASEAEDFNPEPSAKESEETSQEQKSENLNSVKFTTIFDGSNDDTDIEQTSKEINSDSSKSIISIQGSKMLARVSSTLSKVFSRSNPNIPKSCSKPHQDDH
ncbi:fibrous sheath-interacting protein 2 [Perognathus longimembris pacificus]|uniref:fibrous sheath-interacting protein 2 n=1 Tax=Perognathus longimembris pacificus TaxID=214514 RepID=UPI002019EB8C|nr:fibrous sheath-interacting protein 2 [Perognathus longimembris pacificus]